MSKKQDIVIIGAGVIGCSIAYHLGRKGIRSQIIERESIGARASGKAWGVITYPPILLVAEKIPDTGWALPEGETYAEWLGLFWAGYRRMADLSLDIKEKGGVDIDYAEPRSTYLLSSDQPEYAAEEAVLSVFRANGAYECEWLGSDELRATFGRISWRLPSSRDMKYVGWTWIDARPARSRSACSPAASLPSPTTGKQAAFA